MQCLGMMSYSLCVLDCSERHMNVVSMMWALAQKEVAIDVAELGEHVDSIIAALTGVDLHPCLDMSAAEEAAAACGAAVYLGTHSVIT